MDNETGARSRHGGFTNIERFGKCPAIRWRDQEKMMGSMTSMIANNRPFVMKGKCLHQILNGDAIQRWRTFGGIKSVLRAHELEELRVHVACANKGDPFRGDYAHLQQVDLRLIDLVELAEASEAGKPHWAAAEEVGLDYYLCQCPIVSREEGKPEVLNAIAGEVRTPSFVREEDLLQINLWLGARSTTTNMHYDANNNLLFVLRGKKTVFLLPPTMTGEIQAMPIFSESANHSELKVSCAAEVVARDEAREGAVYAEIGEEEALFIPEGWWHQVSSVPGTVAINVWFKGMRTALCDSEPSRHMREYYLRCLLESLLSDSLKDATERHSTNDLRETGLSKGRAGVAEQLRTLQPTADISPLVSSSSSVEERNIYLRTMSIARMREELPTIALTRPQMWARLVQGLDPLTAHVLTTEWGKAGGAEGMQELYQVIFGEGGSGPSTDDLDQNAEGTVDCLRLSLGEKGVTPAWETSLSSGLDDLGRQAEVSVRGAKATRDATLGSQGLEKVISDPQIEVGEGGDGLPPRRSKEYFGDTPVGHAGMAESRSPEVRGIKLQQRLVRLREAFAEEECHKVLSRAVGL